MNTEDIDILLAKYFSGEASVGELDMLDGWLAQSEANQAYFDQMTVLYERATPYIPSRKPDVARAWNMFERHMLSSEKTNRNRNLLKPEKRRLTFYIPIAAALLMFIGVAMFFYLQKDTGNKQIQIVADANTVNYTMPDNCVIQLSADSKIAYNEGYGKNNRDIQLIGKASFNVKNENSEKLVINTGETFIQDIGTVFEVNAYPDSKQTIVSVESGKVLFYTATDNGIELEAGEIGVYDKETRTFSKLDDTDNTLSSSIVFEATPLAEVIATLSNKYNVDIKLVDNKLSDKQITVVFAQDDSVDNILQIIAETLLLNVRLENNVYILYSK